MSILFAPLKGQAVLVHDCSRLDELQPMPQTPSPIEWTAVLLSEELASLVCRHLNARIVAHVCHTWRNLAQSRSIMTGFQRDVHCARYVGGENPLQAVGVSGEPNDICALAVLDGQVICAADATGVITLWRLSPSGEVGRLLGTLTQHAVVDQLLADGDSLISTGTGGRRSTILVTTLIPGARARLLEGDDKEFATPASDTDIDGGASLAQYVTSVRLPLPFESGNLGFRAALSNGRLYVTPADPIDTMADFEPTIAVWERGTSGLQSPFVAVGVVASGTREFAEALAAWKDRLFSSHPTGI